MYNGMIGPIVLNPEDSAKLRKDLCIPSNRKNIQIENIHPGPEDVIVFKYSLNDYCFDEVMNIFNTINEAFSNNKVVGIPDNVTLQTCTKEEIQDIILYLQENMPDN